MSLDIFGACGSHACPKSGDCRTFIAASYKFFFAIENSICSGYITEKFFDTLKLDIVPVVLGRVGYESWIPRSGFINAADYASAEDLGEYLLQLGEDEVAYNKYFAWKRYLRVEPRPAQQAYLCEMCIRLNLEERSGVVERKVLRKMKERYGMSENCWGYEKSGSNGAYSLVKGKNLVPAFFMSMESGVYRY